MNARRSETPRDPPGTPPRDPPRDPPPRTPFRVDIWSHGGFLCAVPLVGGKQIDSNTPTGQRGSADCRYTYIYIYIYIWLPKVKYDIGAEILLPTCTLDVKGVFWSYSKILPAIHQHRLANNRDRSQDSRSNFENRKHLVLHHHNHWNLHTFEK